MTRQVMVDREALAKALEGHTRFDSSTGWSTCASCYEPAYDGKHAPNCPVPALQAALTQPQSSSASCCPNPVLDDMTPERVSSGDTTRQVLVDALAQFDAVNQERSYPPSIKGIAQRNGDALLRDQAMKALVEAVRSYLTQPQPSDMLKNPGKVNMSPERVKSFDITQPSSSAGEVQAIEARLKAIEHIEITDDTSGQKHYGFNIGIGNCTLKSLWHCSDDRTHPDEAEYLQKGWDTADLYCDSHYATVDDEAMLTFLLNAQKDIRFLLRALAAQQPKSSSAGEVQIGVPGSPLWRITYEQGGVEKISFFSYNIENPDLAARIFQQQSQWGSNLDGTPQHVANVLSIERVDQAALAAQQPQPGPEGKRLGIAQAALERIASLVRRKKKEADTLYLEGGGYTTRYEELRDEQKALERPAEIAEEALAKLAPQQPGP